MKKKHDCVEDEAQKIFDKLIKLIFKKKKQSFEEAQRSFAIIGNITEVLIENFLKIAEVDKKEAKMIMKVIAKNRSNFMINALSKATKQ